LTPPPRPLRYFWNLLGFLALGLGIIGIPLPVLPTTPFILLAAYLFAKGSPRYHAWLRNHKTFGKIVRDWEEHGSIPTRAKIIATVMIAIAISFPLWITRENVPVEARWATAILAGIGWTYVITRPSGPASGPSKHDLADKNPE